MGLGAALQRGLTNFRIKDRCRFGDPELVAVRYETGCREVFDYHEAICDLIDAERRNGIEVSLFTLARIIHDEEGFTDPEWFERRRRMLLALRDRKKPLVMFDGDVESAHDQLAISLPEDTYVKWHTDGGAKSEKAKKQPRNANGTFTVGNRGEQGKSDYGQAAQVEHAERHANERSARRTTASDSPTAKHPQMQDVSECGDRKDVAEPQRAASTATTQHHTTPHNDEVVSLPHPTPPRRTWTDEVADLLTCLTEGDDGKRNHLKSELWIHARRHNLTDTTGAYVRAAKAFATKVEDGWKPNRPNGALPYFLSTVSSYRQELTVTEPTPTEKEPSPYDRATRIA